ncbi:MAG: DUF2249 domain-containing protein [Acidithiobacillus ferrivorans]|jgi:uncharacterized protein (DUF2249 family)
MSDKNGQEWLGIHLMIYGETMPFINNHGPRVLLEQLRARYGERVEIAYEQRELRNIRIRFTVHAGATA